MTQYNFTDGSKYEAPNLTKKLKQAVVRVDTNDYDSVKNVPITQKDVESAMTKVDIQGLIDEEKQKYSIQEYDGNGLGDLNDEELKNRNDITGDTAYILETSEGKTFFQPFVPYVGGKEPLNSGNWRDVAKQHQDRKARQQAFGKILTELKNHVEY
jgi:hypothetical protein